MVTKLHTSKVFFFCLCLFEYTSVCVWAEEWAGLWHEGSRLFKGCCGPSCWLPICVVAAADQWSV